MFNIIYASSVAILAQADFAVYVNQMIIHFGLHYLMPQAAAPLTACVGLFARRAGQLHITTFLGTFVRDIMAVRTRRSASRSPPRAPVAAPLASSTGGAAATKGDLQSMLGEF